MATLIELERGLTNLFADWLNMEVDSEIFRGFVPEEISSAVSVFLLEDIQGNEEYIPKYTFQVNGKFLERDKALEMGNIFRTKLPAYGITLNNGIKVSEILKQSGGSVVPFTSDGKNVFEVFISGEVYFRDFQ